MFRWIRACGAAVAAWVIVASAAAQASGDAQEMPVRYGSVDVQYVVHDDMTSTETRRWSLTVLKPQALEWAKQARVTHSTSVQKVDVLEAYTRKADGRRIDVPKENYQVNINQGRENGGPIFSDFSTVSVVFPDLAAGDTIVFGYRISQREPIFPGHFDTGEVFDRYTRFDAVTAGVEYPTSLAVHFEGRGMQQTVSTPAPGRKAVQWRWSNVNPARNTRRDYSVFDPDQEVGFDFSTFSDHAAIAAAYGKRADPKAAVTERVRALAAEIVGSRSSPREQAQALYEWVATKITYGGNCVGVGTVVPRDLDVVLDNRMGDCKDHATLLQALLAARGIPSHQALVNAGSVHTLPRIARVSAVNHVINHLPTLGLYVDSTAGNTPFSHLPVGLRGKPVLVAGAGGAGARLPVPANANDQKTVSVLKIAADGSLSGTVEAYLKGDVAIGMREWARQLPPESRPDMARQMLRSMGLSGSGSLEMDDPTELRDSYHMKLTLARVEKFVKTPGSGAFHIAPLIGGATIGRIISPGSDEPAAHPSSCTNGSSTELYTIELPKGMRVTALPEAARFSSSVQRYEASYSRKGSVIQVRRFVEDRTPTAVCQEALLDEFGRFGSKVHDNLKAQVLYR